MRWNYSPFRWLLIAVLLPLTFFTWYTGISLTRTFRYKPPAAANVTILGRGIVVSEELLKSLTIPPTNYHQLTRKTVKNFVFVTGISSDHFDESKDAIASIQTWMPGYTIVLYDLGLSKEEIQQVRNFCDVVYRRFHFDRYPTHVAHLRNYAFKPLIIQEVLLSHRGVFWFDASVRLLGNLTSTFSQMVETGGLLQFWHSPHSNHAITNPSLYRYIPTDVSRQMDVQTRGAAAVFLYKTQKIYYNIIFWWVMCALDKHCIAPVEAKLKCDFKKYGFRQYAGCHRFDMSVLNLLASNLYGYRVEQYTAKERRILILVRRVTNMYALEYCQYNGTSIIYG